MDLQVFIIDELESIKNKDKLPLEFFINFHINGNKEVNYRVPVMVNDSLYFDFSKGTFDLVEVEKYKHKLSALKRNSSN